MIASSTVLPKQIDLRADGCRFGHFDLAGTGLAEIASGDHGIIQFFQIPDVYLRTQDSHLNKQVAFFASGSVLTVPLRFRLSTFMLSPMCRSLAVSCLCDFDLHSSQKLFVNCGHFSHVVCRVPFPCLWQTRRSAFHISGNADRSIGIIFRLPAKCCVLAHFASRRILSRLKSSFPVWIQDAALIRLDLFFIGIDLVTFLFYCNTFCSRSASKSSKSSSCLVKCVFASLDNVL